MFLFILLAPFFASVGADAGAHCFGPKRPEFVYHVDYVEFDAPMHDARPGEKVPCGHLVVPGAQSHVVLLLDDTSQTWRVRIDGLSVAAPLRVLGPDSYHLSLCPVLPVEEQSGDMCTATVLAVDGRVSLSDRPVQVKQRRQRVSEQGHEDVNPVCCGKCSETTSLQVARLKIDRTCQVGCREVLMVVDAGIRSSFEKAGVRVGDAIGEVNGTPVGNLSDSQIQDRLCRPDPRVITLLRDNSCADIEIDGP